MYTCFKSAAALLATALLASAAVPITPRSATKYPFTLNVYSSRNLKGSHWKPEHGILYGAKGCSCWPLTGGVKDHVESFDFHSKAHMHVTFYSDNHCVDKTLLQYDGASALSEMNTSPALKAKGVKICLA
ncbi:hypothetical protein BJ138DRAFT_737938 [Hygrophoropsis aurantiaca]|uniref:Uncharacterized protein n=1 Tax=Hygrophoropsis aurantiaca TaxID=72124 RepID=A0ACB8AIH2_9AGAM|nr:hypothetical protein BJ138DRAFT_737938 [Hygrophoropsis aurantiaca]